MKITYTQNEVSSEVSGEVKAFGMSVIWDLAMNEMEKGNIERLEILKDIHGILGAVLHGEIKTEQ